MPKVLDGTRPDALQVQDLHITYAGNYDGVMKTFLDATVRERLQYGEGEILIARSSRPDIQGLAIWRGPYHEVTSWLPCEGESDGLNPVDRFTPFAFFDTPTGVTITSTGPEIVIETVETVTDIDGIGTLFMFPAKTGLSRVPTWRGASIPVGEVWRTDIRNSENSPVLRRLTIAGPRMVASLAIDPDAKAPYAKQLEFVGALTAMSFGPAGTSKGV